MRVILWWALANPTCMPNLKSLSSAVAEILTGNTQILVSSLLPGTHILSYGCDFMMGLGKSHLHAKFEVAFFCRCRNIDGEHSKFWELPIPGGRPFFLLGVILWWTLANPTYMLNLKSLASAVAEIFKEHPKFWGAPLAQVHAHFLFWLWFYDGP